MLFDLPLFVLFFVDVSVVDGGARQYRDVLEEHRVSLNNIHVVEGLMLTHKVISFLIFQIIFFITFVLTQKFLRNINNLELNQRVIFCGITA